MDATTYLELVNWSEATADARKPAANRSGRMYKLVDGAFEPTDEKKAPSIGDTYSLGDTEELPELEFSPRVTVTCVTKEVGTLYHVLQTDWSGFKCRKRYKKYVLFIRYCYPIDLEQHVKATIEECAEIGAVAAIPMIPNVALMISAFGAAFKTCIVAKGLAAVDGFSFRVYKDSYYTPWRKC